MSYYNISCEELSYYGVDDNFSVNFDTSFGSCLQTCLYLADVFCDVVVCTDLLVRQYNYNYCLVGNLSQCIIYVSIAGACAYSWEFVTE